MEFRIEHNGLIGFEHTSFAVDLVKLTKEAKSKSYPNLSNCCKGVLKQVKNCSICGNPVDSAECQHKLFKLGKEEIPISTAHLDSIKKALDKDVIVISEFRDRSEIPEMYFTDVLFSAKQHKKYKKEYLEYAEILSQSNKVAIGETCIRSRPYPIMMYAYQGRLVIRGLHYFEEVNAIPAVDNQVPISRPKIELLMQVLKFNENKNPFDIGKFINYRDSEEEKLIERTLKGEALPVIEQAEVKTPQDDSEIQRLTEMLKQRQQIVATPAETAK
jgi:non-homologous end joining protein Ku